MKQSDLGDWPRAASGRYLCTPERPMPANAPGQWEHRGGVDDGECYEGCCDDYRCKDCDARWRIAAPQ